MSTDSAIRWTHRALPLVTGCDYEGPGCRSCYAPRWAYRFSHHPNAQLAARYQGTVAKTANSRIVWTGHVRYNDQVLHTLLLASRRKQLRWFISRDGDLFHSQVTDAQIARVFAAALLRPDQQLILLTKRATRTRSFLAAPGSAALIQDEARRLLEKVPEKKRCLLAQNRLQEFGTSNSILPMANVVVGFSAEDQRRFDERWVEFREIAAAGWMIATSAEPLLRPLLLPSDYLALGDRAWLIVGGESGPTARPVHPAWLRSLRDQCVPAGVLFFVKQWGVFTEVALAGAVQANILAGTTTEELVGYARDCIVVWPDGRSAVPERSAPWWAAQRFGADRETVRPGEGAVLMRRVGVASAGYLLDGQDWDRSPPLPAAA